ncbi:MAG: hypothetical protein K5978_02735 [Campylobacter sp.]|nr:hypothetical protein [Campylobacter sp.]
MSEFNENEILTHIKDDKLETAEIDKLLALNKKDINIALARCQNLNDTQVATLIKNGVYMVISNLIDFQNLSEENKTNLIEKMQKMPKLYSELLTKFGSKQ